VNQVNRIRKQVLLVDDEPQMLAMFKLSLKNCVSSDILVISDSREVLPLLTAEPITVIVLDLHMPKLSGLELLPRIIRDFPHIPVIVVTADDQIDTVVDCMKMGAFDYLVKPVEPRRLATSVSKALDLCDLSTELQSLKKYLLADQLEHPDAFAEIITGNRKMRTLFQYVEVVAPSRQPIMITGETGVGKELLAQAIHDLSGCKGELVPLNVAGLDDTLFSDTLFGHKKGAFTGADNNRDGLIARAAGGTLFLDEVGDLTESSQVKLLRLLQGMEYYPVGADLARKSDARVVLASNRDLQQLIADRKFRNDLYYRVCAHQVTIPPLRERLDDIPLLLDRFLAAAATAFKKKKPTPPPELVTLLSLYHFPGNVRQLEAMVYDAVARHTFGILSMESFRKVIGVERTALPVQTSRQESFEKSVSGLFGHFPTISEVEKHLIEEAMTKAKGNQGFAADLLGITRQTLSKRLKT
jgi:DNA-binding NtrC family response regulator